MVAIQELFRRVHVRPFPRGEVVDNPKAVYLMMGDLTRCTTEEFWVVLLDSRLRAIDRINVARGGRNAVSVMPRDVFSPAAREPRCSAVVLIHNHPSGDPAPSQEDLVLTQRLVAAGELLGIVIRDHVIIGDGKFSSLAELGHIGWPSSSPPRDRRPT